MNKDTREKVLGDLSTLGLLFHLEGVDVSYEEWSMLLLCTQEVVEKACFTEPENPDAYFHVTSHHGLPNSGDYITYTVPVKKPYWFPRNARSLWSCLDNMLFDVRKGWFVIKSARLAAKLDDLIEMAKTNFASSPLFSGEDHHESGEWLCRSRIPVPNTSINILYSGLVLREDEKNIWLQLLTYAQKYPWGHQIRFSYQQLMQDMGWKSNVINEARIEVAITRLCNSEILVCHANQLESLSLIERRKYWMSSKEWQVYIDPKLIILFGSSIDREEREKRERATGNAIASTRLSGHVLSPEFVLLNTLYNYGGITDNELSQISRDKIDKMINPE